MTATLPIARVEARITPAVEDYLKAIYQLNQEEPAAGSVTGQRIAERAVGLGRVRKDVWSPFHVAL